MSNKQVFFVLIAVVVVLLAGVGGGVYESNSLLAKESSKLVSLKQKDGVLSQEKLSLIQAQKDIAKYSSLETIAQAVVPQDKDQAEAVREIVNIAAASGISPSGITFPTSTLGQLKAGSTAAVAPPVGSNKLTQVTPVVGIPGVYSLPITIQQNSDSPVSYNNFIDFLARLEDNRRTAQVSNIVLQPDTKNPNLLTFTLSLNEYIKP